MSMSYTEYLEALEEYQHLLAEAEMQIRTLEAGRAEQNAPAPAADPFSPGESGSADSVQRIRELRAAAEKRRSELNLME
jgi:hypothetical protein